MLIREVRPDEYAMVVSDWSKSYKRRARLASPGLSDAAIRTYIDLATSRYPTLCVVDDATNLVGGWICGDSSYLMYVYVRYGMRGAGLARLLHEAIGSPTTSAFPSHMCVEWDSVGWLRRDASKEGLCQLLEKKPR